MYFHDVFSGVKLAAISVAVIVATSVAFGIHQHNMWDAIPMFGSLTGTLMLGHYIGSRRRT